MLDLYDILGVPKDADDRAIKSAFRRMARLHHPDLNPGDERAQERFIELAAAFEILSDPTSRELYDEFGLESLREDFDPNPMGFEPLRHHIAFGMWRCQLEPQGQADPEPWPAPHTSAREQTTAKSDGSISSTRRRGSA